MRVGIGYDVHRLVEGKPLILGGVHIPFHLGLEGHSDADVLIHAIMDALLGAAALGDIGHYFPPSDPKYKGISSLKLLDEVRWILKDKNVRVINIDATIIAQEPRLSPFIPQMQLNISDVLLIRPNNVSIKATTTEHLGFEGRLEGISCQAIALVEQK